LQHLLQVAENLTIHHDFSLVNHYPNPAETHLVVAEKADPNEGPRWPGGRDSLNELALNGKKIDQ